MCFHNLSARGVKRVRSTKKDGKTKQNAPRRNEKEIVAKKNNRHREARRRPVKEKRARRSWAKIEKEGMKNLRQQGLITA